jgi:hypothetical protein
VEGVAGLVIVWGAVAFLRLRGTATALVADIRAGGATELDLTAAGPEELAIAKGVGWTPQDLHPQGSGPRLAALTAALALVTALASPALITRFTEESSPDPEPSIRPSVRPPTVVLAHIQLGNASAVVTQEELDHRIRSLPRPESPTPLSPEMEAQVKRKTHLDWLVNFKVMELATQADIAAAGQASRRAADDLRLLKPPPPPPFMPDFRPFFLEDRTRYYRIQPLIERIIANVSVDDADVRKYYQEHRFELLQPLEFAANDIRSRLLEQRRKDRIMEQLDALKRQATIEFPK